MLEHFENFLETSPVFATAVLCVQFLGRESVLSEWKAGLYFSARLIYLPLYVAGVRLLRSLVWNIAFLGVALLLLASSLARAIDSCQAAVTTIRLPPAPL